MKAAVFTGNEEFTHLGRWIWTIGVDNFEF